ETASLVQGYLSYVASEEGQERASRPDVAGSAPISGELRTEVEAAIESISAAEGAAPGRTTRRYGPSVCPHPDGGSVTLTQTPKPTTAQKARPSASGTGRLGNKIFAALSTTSGVLILVTLAAVALFLLYRAWPALIADDGALAEVDFMLDRSFWAWVAPLAFGTVLSSFLALVVAVPLSVGIGLFISHYAPRRLAQVLGYLVDLLAAIPSVIFGLWGIQWLQPLLDPAFAWVSTHLGFIPVLAGYQAPARNILTAGLVLAIMIVPI